MPAPITGTRSASPAESPTKAARPADTMASQPCAASTVCRSQVAALALAMAASAFAAAPGLWLCATTLAIAPLAPSAPWMSPASASERTPRRCAAPSVEASASSKVEWPAASSAWHSAASGRASPSVP